MKKLQIIAVALSLLILAGCPDVFQEPDTEEIKENNKTGIFVYNITLPTDLIRAELTLRSVSQNSYIGKIDLLGDNNNKGEFSSLRIGYYRVIFDLYREDCTSAGKTESVYIGDGQTTTLTTDLSDLIFAPAPDPVQSYTITRSGPVALDNLSENQVLAVAVNKASVFVNYLNAGGISSYTLNGIKYQVALTGRSVTETSINTFDRDDPYAEQGDKIPLRYDKPEAGEFNANPLPIPSTARNMRSVQASGFISPVVGDKRQFWLDDADKTNTWQQKQATLAAVSNRANIWIIDDYHDNKSADASDNKLTTAQAQAMADKFDAIYQYTTPIFGHEYGNGSDSSQPGGVDGDQRIQILVYDIGADGTHGGTIGYFWSKDHYTNEYLQSQNSNYKSNLAEIFYIDSHWTDSQPETVYSVLIHEFVHMINFNEKFVKQNQNYATWYTEMLAMLGEDMIGPLIGISPESPGHPIKTRIPYTLGLYSCNPFFWTGTKSYGVTFGFGAYLARNYGGAALIREIARNDKVNFDSISDALSIFDPSVTFTNIIERYHEAFVCNDAWDRGMASFNRTVTSTINGHRYTMYGFDIYKINRVNVALSPSYISYWSTNERGPFLYGLTQNFYMDNYSFILLSCADWQNVSGNMVVDVQRPNNISVDMYLMVR